LGQVRIGFFRDDLRHAYVRRGGIDVRQVGVAVRRRAAGCNGGGCDVTGGTFLESRWMLLFLTAMLMSIFQSI